MLKKVVLLATACFALAACASGEPHVVQVSADTPALNLTPGMATQVEMPEQEHVQSVVVGNPDLLTAEAAGNVVNLVPKDGTGETNLIVRSVDQNGDTKVFQYRVEVRPQ